MPFFRRHRLYYRLNLFHLGVVEITLHFLTHLAHATVDNVATYGTEDSATGPVIRGDLMTIRCHLKALKERAPHCLLYTSDAADE